ncbi:hypothetical protein DB32_005310 [Sandaracinus amylolyticus]|uniref:Uncharacterized protein n=1 Tax=Sandaracinus amylolyticus TaxID=927083 RepID=A0A0F6W5T2_9BACT|nr:hypothetical protein DB32_005310 [Sandaracinus amylolyticus]
MRVPLASEPPPRDAADSDEPPPVPAGTWASTSEIESEPPPSPLRATADPDTRRIRKISREQEAGTEPEPTREPSRPVRRVRGEAAARGRARGLAIAAAAEEEQDRSDEPARPAARVVAFPTTARAADATPVQSASASSSGMRAQTAPVGPPQWLASELLRERPAAEPMAWTSRGLALFAGAGVVTAAMTLAAGEAIHLGIAGLGAAIALVAIAPLRFAMRAGAFAVLASLGLVVATMARSSPGGAEGLAAMGTTLLAAAQLLRWQNRASRFARAAMGVGVAVSASWLILDGGLDAMVVHAGGVDAWLGPAMRALLLVVLALSLLAFIDDSSDSGCRVWPWLVLGWGALDGMVASAIGPAWNAAGAATTPLFAAVAAVGWMQVWATTPGLGRESARAKGDG